VLQEEKAHLLNEYAHVFTTYRSVVNKRLYHLHPIKVQLQGDGIAEETTEQILACSHCSTALRKAKVPLKNVLHCDFGRLSELITLTTAEQHVDDVANNKER